MSAQRLGAGKRKKLLRSLEVSEWGSQLIKMHKKKQFTKGPKPRLLKKKKKRRIHYSLAPRVLPVEYHPPVWHPWSKGCGGGNGIRGALQAEVSGHPWHKLQTEMETVWGPWAFFFIPLEFLLFLWEIWSFCLFFHLLKWKYDMHTKECTNPKYTAQWFVRVSTLFEPPPGQEIEQNKHPQIDQCCAPLQFLSAS